jgi:hypothetical protein
MRHLLSPVRRQVTRRTEGAIESMETILDTHRLDVERQNSRMKSVAVGAAMFAFLAKVKSLCR